VIRARVRQKVEQVQAGRPPFPSVVGIVGFRTARITFWTVEG